MEEIENVWSPLASVCTSVSIYISILISIDENKTFSQGEKLALIHFTTCAIKENPSIATEILYIFNLFMDKNFKDSTNL